MKKSSSLYKQVAKAQKAMRKWPVELKRDVVFIPVERFK